MTSLRGEGSAQPADLEEALSLTFTELLYKVTALLLWLLLPSLCCLARVGVVWRVAYSGRGWNAIFSDG